MVDRNPDDGRSLVTVVALGVVCELKDVPPSIDLGEFADLDDGRRIFWKNDRGWSGAGFYPDCKWPLSNGRHLAYEAIMVTGDKEDGVDDYVEHAYRTLRELGHRVNRSSVHFAPFRVEYGPRLEREFRALVQRFEERDI